MIKNLKDGFISKFNKKDNFMKQIKFMNFNISEGYVEFYSNYYEYDVLIKSDLLYFELSEKIIVNNNLIALALSTLCGSVYDKIYFDLELNNETLCNIEKFTNSKVYVKKSIMIYPLILTLKKILFLILVVVLIV